MKLLVVEDQTDLREILSRRLSEEGYVVDAAEDGEQALTMLEFTQYDLIVLDIMIPHINGLDLLRHIRANGGQTPVLLLTARDAVSDRVEGLDAGADDYLIKPFSFEELLARLRSLLRRKERPIESVLSIADLRLDRTNREVRRGGHLIDLTKKEYAILEHLMLNQGIVVSRERLEAVSTSYDYDGYSNVIDVYIRFLRKKIDEGHDVKLIHTKRGFGYVMRVDE
jgi:DNA-binding response OmpR family regulator